MVEERWEVVEEEWWEEEKGWQEVEKPWWMHWAVPFLLSGGVHLLMLWIAVLVVFLIPMESVGSQINFQEPPFVETPYDMNLKRDVFRTPRVEDHIVKEHSIIVLDEEKILTRDVPRGTSLDCLANKNLASTGVTDAYGIGGQRAGAYGLRWGHGSFPPGSGPGTESAVLAALLWLWRHQNRKNDPDAGGWSMNGFHKWCKPGEVCKNDLGASPYFDVGVSSLALLAFLGHGNTHRVGKFRRTVQMGLEYLLRNQSSEGWFGKLSETHEWIYNHALATMAVCEAYGMTQDPWLREPCERAIDCIIRAQNPGAGWRYDPGSGENDTSVTGWMILALKGAKSAGINVPANVWDGAIKWFDRCTDPTTGRVGYQKPGDLGSVIRGVNEQWEKLPTMTSVAVICRIFCGQSRSDPIVKRSVDFLMKHLPTWDTKGMKVDMYYWYYGTYALFQYGGQPWKDWNTAMKKALLDTQRRMGCADGSWDPICKWGMVGGRVYSTAINALTLEIYYRYRRYYEGKGIDPEVLRRLDGQKLQDDRR
ncbi:MAG: terpene cyclase/mutase family protein [Planctomycetota bacterium]|nr:terpene cyclase/mutase family protein [Planctomycetota bacterium]